MDLFWERIALFSSRSIHEMFVVMFGSKQPSISMIFSLNELMINIFIAENIIKDFKYSSVERHNCDTKNRIIRYQKSIILNFLKLFFKPLSVFY